MTAIEKVAIVDGNGILKVEAGQNLQHKKVRVLILVDDEPEEEAWLRNASNSEVFNFLLQEKEEIYSLKDGKPLSDEI